MFWLQIHTVFHELFFLVEGFYTPWQSRTHAARVASSASSACSWRGANAVILQWQTMSQLGSAWEEAPTKGGWQEGWKHKGNNWKEREREMLERRESKSYWRREWLLQQTFFFPPPLWWKYDKVMGDVELRVRCSCLLFSSSLRRIHA